MRGLDLLFLQSEKCRIWQFLILLSRIGSSSKGLFCLTRFWKCSRCGSQMSSNIKKETTRLLYFVFCVLITSQKINNKCLDIIFKIHFWHFLRYLLEKILYSYFWNVKMSNTTISNCPAKDRLSNFLENYFSTTWNRVRNFKKMFVEKLITQVFRQYVFDKFWQFYFFEGCWLYCEFVKHQTYKMSKETVLKSTKWQ